MELQRAEPRNAMLWLSTLSSAVGQKDEIAFQVNPLPEDFFAAVARLDENLLSRQTSEIALAFFCFQNFRN
jgi:hypothetical protein